MKKLIKALAVTAALFTALPAFPADLATVKASNSQKSQELKAIRAEMKALKSAVQLAKAEEKSRKLDAQIADARQKLEVMKKTVGQ